MVVLGRVTMDGWDGVSDLDLDAPTLAVMTISPAGTVEVWYFMKPEPPPEKSLIAE